MLLEVAVVASTVVLKVAVITGSTDTFVGAVAAFRSISSAISVPRLIGVGSSSLQLLSVKDEMRIKIPK
jgi:hypothetical protein